MTAADTAGYPGPDAVNPRLLALLTDWYGVKAKAAELATRERELRAEITALAFPDPKEKGTQRLGIGHGKELKLTSKLNYTVDKAALEQAKASLDPDVLANVIRYKPEVVEAGWLAVSDSKLKAKFAAFITSRAASPTLEIVDARKGG